MKKTLSILALTLILFSCQNDDEVITETSSSNQAKKEYFLKIVNNPIENGFKLDSTNQTSRFYSKIKPQSRGDKELLVIPINQISIKKTSSMYRLTSIDYNGWFGYGEYNYYDGGPMEKIWADENFGLVIRVDGQATIYYPSIFNYTQLDLMGDGIIFIPHNGADVDCEAYINDTPTGDLVGL